MRDTFIKTLTQLATEDKDIELVTGDLGFGVLKPFWETCPNQFTNAGIAEQNMVAMAAGMAMEGKKVFVYSIGNFPTLRCLEQIRNDCAYHKLNVTIVTIGGGFVYGSLGMSHQATEDLAVFNAMPDMTVFAPADAAEAAACARAAAACPGTCYIRLGRGGEPKIWEDLPDFQIGRGLQVKEGERAAIILTGAIYDEVAAAVEMLREHGIDPAVYTMPTVKPFDEQLVRKCAETFELIVTVEEHSVIGGLGSMTACVMAEMKRKKAYLKRIGVNDSFAAVAGDQSYLRKRYGVSAQKIADSIISELEA